MINYRYVSKYCKDDLSLIKNYEEAVNSPETWDCHHRLETELNLSIQELKEHDLYYNRPASELIFLTKTEHRKLHITGENNPMYGRTGENNPMYGKNPLDRMTREAIEQWCKHLQGKNNPMYGKPAPNRGKKRVYREDGTYYYA